MTGYGSATERAENQSVVVEARSVNSRGLKLVVKGPPGIEALEGDLRQVVDGFVRRGRVDIFVRLEDADEGKSMRELDEQRVADLLAGARRLKDEYGVEGEIDLAALGPLGALFRERVREFDPEAVSASILAATSASMAGLVEMREREGTRLDADLRGRLEALDAGLAAAEELAPERLERERARLKAAVAEVAEKGFDEDRIAREIAMIADRWDVGEELVRARSHVAAFAEFLALPADEPVGKRLGFLVQELQREVNTLGAKANDTRITKHVVEMKNEIEKLREQVENVE